MRKYVFVCDRCKEEVVNDVDSKPKDWERVEIRMLYNRYDYSEIMLCDKCLLKLGFEPKEKISINDKSIAERLLDIFEEINSASQQ